MSDKSKPKFKPTLKSHVEVNLEDDIPLLNEVEDGEIIVPIFFPETNFIARNNSTPQLSKTDKNESEIGTINYPIPKSYIKKPKCNIDQRNKSLPIDYNLRTPPPTEENKQK